MQGGIQLWQDQAHRVEAKATQVQIFIQTFVIRKENLHSAS